MSDVKDRFEIFYGPPVERVIIIPPCLYIDLLQLEEDAMPPLIPKKKKKKKKKRKNYG